MAPDLPLEVIFFGILTRLPAKSAFRFRCVSKPWYSFLKTQTFSNMHLHNIPNGHHQNPNKQIFLSTTAPYTFHTIDCEAPEDGYNTTRSLPFEAKNMSIQTSFHGLVCVGLKINSFDNEFSDIVLWNPLTGDYKTLSKANSHKGCFNVSQIAFELYYNSFEDDYKLLCVTYNYGIYIYSLKLDSWKKVDSNFDFERVSVCWDPSNWLDERLYFLSRVPSYSVITFDTKTEKMKEIATPSFRNKRITALSLNVLRGCVHFYVVYDDLKLNVMDYCLKIELWRMDEDRGWENVGTYRRHVVSSPWFLRPLHVMKNGNWLIKSKDEDCIYKVDPEKNTCDISCWYNRDCFRISLKGKYVETLVSPNRYMK